MSFVAAFVRWAFAVCACIVLAATAWGQDITPVSKSNRLTITWGGGTEAAWTGQMQIDRGTLAELKLLGNEPDSPGSIWIDRAQVHVQSINPRKVDGIEVVATAADDATLLVELASDPKAPPTKMQIPLASLARKPYRQRLDDRGNELQVRILDDANLEISFHHEEMVSDANAGSPSRQPLIFAPGERLEFSVSPKVPASLHGTTLDLQTTLSPARKNDALWTDNQRLAVSVEGKAQASVMVPMQVPEGVYTVHVNVSRSSGYLRDKFFPGASAAIAVRSFQVVVIAPQASPTGEAGRWEPVLEIDPTNPRWVERLPAWTQLRRLPGMSSLHRGAIGNVRVGAVDLALGRFIELPPTPTGTEPAWQAYTLPLQATGVPHLLEISYPADAEQHLTLSLMEPNATGTLEGVQRNTGVFVEGLGLKTRRKETQKILFWPRTQTPLLVVANQHPKAAGHFGQIRVLRRIGPLEDNSPANTPAARAPLASDSASPNPTALHEPLVAAYLNRPFLGESLGAAGAALPTKMPGDTRSLADYQTHYENSTRLAEFAHHGGYNGVVVNVMAEGSSIFPSSLQSFTPRYESGRLAHEVQDHDGLELLLRVFDREGLTMIPALSFNFPLARLEPLRRAGNPQATGIELIGPDGLSWLAHNRGARGLAPYYNILHPQVQQAMAEVVEEVVTRYGHHTSFGGVAIQLSSDGYAQLPTLEWALDDDTTARFSRETGTVVADDGPNRFASRFASLTREHADAWQAWRIEQLTNFYARLATTVRGNSNRKLLLTTDRLFDHQHIRQRIRPNLLAKNVVPATLREMGIDPAHLAQVPGLVLCPTHYIAPAAPLADRAVDLELNAACQHDWLEATSATDRSTTLYHRPIRPRLDSLAAQIPMRSSREFALSELPMPAGPAARQPYLHALLNGQPNILLDGGEMLPLADDDSLRSIRNLIRSLPTASSAQVEEFAKQSVVVRSYREPGQVTLLVMNASPWRCDAQLALEIPQPAGPAPSWPAAPARDSGFLQTLRLPAGKQAWNIALEPYDIRAVRIPNPGARVAAVETTLPSEAIAELQQSLEELANRDLASPHPYNPLTNPGFEAIGNAPLVGWHVVKTANAASANLDPNLPQEGNTSLYLRSDGPFAAVESEDIPIPAAGQLAVSIFARGQNLAPDADLRLVVESEQDGQLYRRSAPIQGSLLIREGEPWGRPLATWLADLPLDSNRKMRIRFELHGKGEVWLDNVKLHDLLFPLKFYQNSHAEILQLLQRSHEVQAAHDAGNTKDTLLLLESYWPRFVLAYTPPSTPPVAATPSQTPPTQPTEPTPESPSISERLKNFVPLFR